MAYEIIWTKKFSESYFNNIEYLETNWNVGIINLFVATVDEMIETLSIFPLIGDIEDNVYNYRGIVISKIHTIFYRIENNKIILIELFDNRSNPETKFKQ